MTALLLITISYDYHGCFYLIYVSPIRYYSANSNDKYLSEIFYITVYINYIISCN